MVHENAIKSNTIHAAFKRISNKLSFMYNVKNPSLKQIMITQEAVGELDEKYKASLVLSYGHMALQSPIIELRPNKDTILFNKLDVNLNQIKVFCGVVCVFCFFSCSIDFSYCFLVDFIS